MKRVASLYLPHWSIDRVLRAERRRAPPPKTAPLDLLPLKTSADAERVAQCDAPRNSGWRPGARWALADREAAARDVESRIAALPPHRRPPMRELGRRSEAADMPFKRLPGDEEGRSGGSGSSLPAAAAFEATRAPLVTIHKVGGRIEIAAASPGARALGVYAGMALTQARASVPNLELRDADPHGDRADLERLAIAIARRWTPIVAISGKDGLFLDVTGVAHLHGGEEAMVRGIVRLLARVSLTARIAVADTTGAAWALARFSSDDVLVVKEKGETLLAPLPVAALRLDEPAIGLLRRLGVGTIGELLAIPRAPLVRRFGPMIARRVDQATGVSPEPLNPVMPPEPIAITRRFTEPIATANVILQWLSSLVSDLAAALARAGQGARVIIFVAERVDGGVQALRIGLARPTRDPGHILRLIARRIEHVDPGYGVEALTLHVRRADPLGAEAFDRRLTEAETPELATLIDTLANRIGQHGLWRYRPVESDVPERSVARIAPLDSPEGDATSLKPDDVRRLDHRTPDHPWHPRRPRPARLLRRPEPLDNVMAELPDYPPVRFTWRGEIHRVVRADGPERIAGEWWRRPSERDAVRDYFQVEDEAGARFWLFRRGDGERAATGDLAWFMHGTFG